MTQFFLNQKESNKASVLKSHILNSQQYQNENNIQSTLSKLINGPQQQVMPSVGLTYNGTYQSQNGRHTSSPDKIRRNKKIDLANLGTFKQTKQF